MAWAVGQGIGQEADKGGLLVRFSVHIALILLLLFAQYA